MRYRLDELGWWQFEELCQAVLKSMLGPTVLSWGGRADAGRDAYCEGDLDLGDKVVRPGPFIFQAKFVENANASGAKPDSALIKAVRAEAGRIHTRAAAGKWEMPRHYVLLTNVCMSASLREDVAAVLVKAMPTSNVCCWGGADLGDMLDSSPKLRTAFPQLLGLRDLQALLSEITNRAVLERSVAQLEKAKTLSPIFVPTQAYHDTLETLQRQGFAVLSGPPEMGKTTIALMIGIAKMGEGWEFYDCLHPDDFLKLRDAEKAQVFVVDDAFGSTEYRHDLATPWGDQMERILRRVDNRHWLIWTSRPAPLKAAMALMDLQGVGESFPKLGEVSVDACRLSVQEKAKILYRHAKAAHLPEDKRDLVRRYAFQLVQHKHFTPERIRSFVGNGLAQLSMPSAAAGSPPKQAQALANELRIDPVVNELIRAELERPTERMRRAFDHLTPPQQALLIAMLGTSGTLIPKVAVHTLFEKLCPGCTTLPDKIAGTLLEQFLHADDDSLLGSQYRWVHPSWRDLVIEHLMENSGDRHGFLAHAGIEGIILALSGSGGATGTREFPLLRDPQDWEILTTSVRHVLSSPLPPIPSALGQLAEWSSRQTVHVRLLEVLDHVASQVQAHESLGEHRLHFRRMLHDGLAHCRQTWLDASACIPSWILLAYYRLSVQASPLPPGPVLDWTWERYWDSAAKGKSAYGHVREFEQALGLVEMIRKYEPRFLLSIGFPNQQRRSAESLLASLEASHLKPEREEGITDDESEPAEEMSRDEYDSEIQECRDERSVLDNIATIFPALTDRTRRVSSALADRKSELEDRRNELEPEDEDKERGRGPEEDEWRYRSGDVDEGAAKFNLTSFFADL